METSDDENLVIICWFYVKNCTIEHYGRQNFSVDRRPLRDLCAHYPLPSGGAKTAPGRKFGGMAGPGTYR